jgi:tRNA dimethylallyltransferase
VLELGLNPPDLATRIAQRTLALYTGGLIEETATLLNRFGPQLDLLRTIGYDEARRLLGGELSRDEAIAITAQRTRQYAKRQRTWFRRQHQALWLEGSDPLQLLRQALNAVAGVLG